MEVARDGARAPQGLESSDGKFVYYSKASEPGIWRIPVEGGEETRVLDHGRGYGWALLEEGICLRNRKAKPGPAIEFYSFATGELEQITVIPPEASSSITVSPDGQWLLYGLRKYESTDIKLVENFR